MTLLERQVTIPRVQRRWRTLVAALVGLHGVAHLVGVTEAVDAFRNDGAIEYVFGRWTITNPMALATFGLIWATLTAGFVLGAVEYQLDRRMSVRLLATTAIVSLAMCVVALPQALIGVGVNLALLAWLVTSHRQAGDEQR